MITGLDMTLALGFVIFMINFECNTKTISYFPGSKHSYGAVSDTESVLQFTLM